MDKSQLLGQSDSKADRSLLLQILLPKITCKELIKQAAPNGVKSKIVPIDTDDRCKDPCFGNTHALILFETPQDALRAIEGETD